MAKNKTVETGKDVGLFLKKIKDEKRRKDFSAVVALIAKETGLEPKMWGTAIVGFGSYHYTYDSGREGEAPLTALASRSNAIALYLTAEFEKREELLKKFGKHKEAKGCIYIKSLGDIDTKVLMTMVKNSITYRKNHYPG